MNYWKRLLTPRNVEEIKPGLFIQKRGNRYRHISPAVWKGKVNWKNLILGQDFGRTFVWFLILMFLAYAHYHDVAVYKEFYETTHGNCARSLNTMRIKDGDIIVCSDFNRQLGLCSDVPDMDKVESMKNRLSKNGSDTNTIPSYDKEVS